MERSDFDRIAALADDDPRNNDRHRRPHDFGKAGGLRPAGRIFYSLLGKIYSLSKNFYSLLSFFYSLLRISHSLSEKICSLFPISYSSPPSFSHAEGSDRFATQRHLFAFRP